MNSSPEIPRAAADLLDAACDSEGLVVWLTGAGISAESGIPTFRGPEGFWTIGSKNYHPMELATRSAFREMPDDVWAWYLYRRSVCRAASPNVAHLALAELEPRLGDRFQLVTQNVDGLHLRAGNSMEATWQIHGNIDFARCSDDQCGRGPWLLPEAVPVDWTKGQPLDDTTSALLRCECGVRARPHVLWFDEYYDEENFRFESSLDAVQSAALLIVVGTSGATNLPMQMAHLARKRGVPILVIDPEANPFSDLTTHGGGAFLPGTACDWVPAICEAL